MSRPVHADGASFLESLLDAVPAIVSRLDPDLRILYANHYIPGLSPESVVGRSALEFISEGSREAASRCFRKAQETGKPGRYEAKAIGPNGGTAHYLNYVSPIAESDGRLGLCVVSVDISEDREREDALRRREQELRLMVNATGMGLWHWDLESGQVTWNDRMKEITGRSEPTDLREWIDGLVHPDDRELVAQSGREALEGKAFRSIFHRIIRPDGAERWVLAVGEVTWDESGRPVEVHGGVLDVTDRRSVEDQLRRAQRMEAVGNLTAGISHNFNNLLMAILPSLEILEDQVDDRSRDLVENALVASRKAADVVRDLMTFVGQGTRSTRIPIRLGEVLDGALKVVTPGLPPHLELEAPAPPDVAILGDPGALEQVFVNLLLNARDALLEGGSTTPRIRIDVELDRRREPVDAIVSVGDNGPGVDAADRERIFDPFFTTKKPRGTGLGLATSRTIVEEHGGSIECRSEPGQGATFFVRLPARDGEPEVAEERSAASSQPPTARRGRLLVVDDDGPVRRITCQMLDRAGWDSDSAPSLARALEMIREAPNFDGVLLDRSLADGRTDDETLTEFRRFLPNAKILLFTGDRIAPGESLDVDGILYKPMTLKRLANRLDDVFGSSSPKARS